MHVTLVSVHVVPDHVAAFIEATRANAAGSLKEPGNLRFDVLRSSQDPNRFILYEAYRDAESAAAHKRTDHYLRWRELVADWMAEPRSSIVYEGFAPDLEAPDGAG